MRSAARRLSLLAACLGGLMVPAVSEGAEPVIVQEFPHHMHVKPPKRWSEEWYQLEAQKPVGARQVEKKGKLWPPFPRPTGKQQPMSHRYHAAHYWPWPYNCQDQWYVRELSQRQVEAGWIAATTLYDYHFDPATQLLNPAGELHLRWILEAAPVAQRVAFVQTCIDPLASQQRLVSVQSGALALVGEENVPPVMLRVSSAAGRPAMEMNQIRLNQLEAMPVPAINYTPLPSTAGSGQ